MPEQGRSGTRDPRSGLSFSLHFSASYPDASTSLLRRIDANAKRILQSIDGQGFTPEEWRPRVETESGDQEGAG